MKATALTLAVILLTMASGFPFASLRAQPVAPLQTGSDTTIHDRRLLGTITGTIVDRSSQEEIIGATVRVIGTKLGAISRFGGHFIIKDVPAGTYQVSVVALGYETVMKTDVIVSTGRPNDLQFELLPTSTGKSEVTVHAEGFQRNPDFVTSDQTFSNEEIRRLPGGFEDVVRAVSLVPGVAQADNGRNDLLVRGGAPSENLYLIDNIEVPNINHFGTEGSGGGPISFVNLDFVRDVNFSTGGFGVRYGDRTSSVLSIDLRDGRTDHLGGKATISASQFGLNLEGPIGSRGDFIFSARRSYLDFLFRALGQSFIPQYWDFLGKAHYRLGERDELTALGIGAIDWVSEINSTDSDRIKNSQIVDNSQNQSVLGLTWKHVENNGYILTTLGRTTISYNYSQADQFLVPIFTNNSLQDEFSLRSDATLILGRSSDLTFGAQGKTTRFTSDVNIKVPFDTLALNASERYYKWALYAQYSDLLFNKLHLDLGTRLDYFSGITTKYYPGLRGALSYDLTDNATLSFSAGQYYQAPSYIWLIGNSLNEQLKEISANVFVLGLARTFGTDFKVRLEGYEKDYSNYPASLDRTYLVLANTGAGFSGGLDDGFAAFGLEPLASEGKGVARGLELSAQKMLSEVPCYGTLSLSYNRARFAAVDGIERPSSYDQTWIFNISGGYKLSELWEVGLKFRYASGRPYTPIDTVTGDPSYGYRNILLYNALRLAASHSLDVRVDKRWPFDTWTLITYVDVQDVYDHINPVPPIFNSATRQITTPTGIGFLPSIGVSAEF